MATNLELVCIYYPDDEFCSADGFDDAVIGVCGEKLVYSRRKCIEILIERDGMTDIDAMEYFDFNVEGAYVGKKTPIWVDDTMFIMFI